jgi:hypothetical protein
MLLASSGEEHPALHPVPLPVSQPLHVGQADSLAASLPHKIAKV